MGPGVPREARLVCVCTNEFARTLPSALRFVANASAPYRTARNGQAAHPRRGAADCGEYRQAAGAVEAIADESDG